MKFEDPSAQATETRLQGQVARGIRWNLADIVPARSGKIFDSLLQQFEGMLVEFESLRRTLPQVGKASFLDLLQQYEEITRMRARIGSYAHMLFTEDTRSQDARTFRARAEEIDTDAANRTLFFELWWKSLEDRRADELMADSGSFRYFLQRLRKTKPFTLSESVEQTINLKDSTGRSILLQLYNQIRSSLVYEIKLEGEKKTLNEEEIRDLFHSTSREERQRAYSSFLSRFRDNKDVLGEIYKALVRDWRNEGIKLRKYSSVIAVRNLANDVPDDAVETLLQVCRENVVVFQRLFEFKAKILDLPEFSRYDIYAPFPAESKKKYSWADGVRLVLDTFRSFDPDFADAAANVVKKGHIDAEAREGKQGGAYCMSITPDITPYILTTYTGNPRSVSTLAHELGHAIHSQLASKQNNQLTFEAPLPLAETASVFGEILLTDKLMEESDKTTMKELLLRLVSEAYSTIGRQAFFVLFEREAHGKIATGVNLDDLSSLYFENLKNQFGSKVSVSSEFENEWLSIPHIFATPFYCYAYAWGNLLVLSLYKMYKEEGTKSFAPRYMKILRYGGGESPEKILAEAGFDIHSKSFWRAGFEELERFLSQLEKLE